MENLLFRFVSVPPLAQQPAVPKTSIKERFPQSLGLKRRRVVNRASRDHFPSPLSPGGRWLPKSTPPAHSWNQVRAVALQSPLETRYSPGSDYTGLPQNLQPVVRSLVPSGRSAPGAGIQACCGIHGCLGHRLGSHVQRACSVRGLDGSPTSVGISIASSCWQYAWP